MLLRLIKKDFLIAKNYMLIMLLVAIFIPLFVFWRAPEFGGEMGFVLSVIFSVFMLLQFVSVKEHQYPKVSALLCAAPYSRKILALSRYGFCIIIYILCTLIYWVETILLPTHGKLSIGLVSGMFLVLSIFIGVFLPVQFKFGYDKTKFIFMLVIMVSPILMPQLAKIGTGFSFSFIRSISPIILNTVVVLTSIVLLTISSLISVKILENKDLV